MRRQHYLRLIFGGFLLLGLSGCSFGIAVIVDANDPRHVVFRPEQHGLMFKSSYPLESLEVVDATSRHTVWSIVASKVLLERSTMDLPSPKEITYGQPPSGCTAQIEAMPLKEGIKYFVLVRGPGYTGSGEFVQART